MENAHQFKTWGLQFGTARGKKTVGQLEEQPVILILRLESAGLFQASCWGEDSSYPSVQGMGQRPWLQSTRDAVESLARSCVTGPKGVILFLTRRNLSHLQYGTSDEDKYQKKLKFLHRARLPVVDQPWKMLIPKLASLSLFLARSLFLSHFPYQGVCT